METRKSTFTGPPQLGIPGLDRLLVTLTALPVLGKPLKDNTFDAVVLYVVPTYGLQTIQSANRFSVTATPAQWMLLAQHTQARQLQQIS
jgi:hypothetical protein